MSELANSPSTGLSPPSQLSTVTLEDLELLLTEGPASPEPLSLDTFDPCERSGLASPSSVPEQDASQRQKQLEQWVAELQAEVVSLRGHKKRCEQATLGLLRELLQVRAHVQMQASELRQLRQEVRQAARSPEKEALEFPGQSQTQMQVLDKRLVEVREALTHIRRRQTLQDSERKGTEQETNLRLARLTGLLKQEEEGRVSACSALQKTQEDTSQKVDHEMAKMQAQVTKLNEEMSLRFLKREAKLCGFLQKSFLAVEQRMKASDSARLRAEGILRAELEDRWQKLQEQTEERLRSLRAKLKEEEGHLSEKRQGLDTAVLQLMEFVQQHQVSLNRVLLAEQEARKAKVSLEESQAGELAAYVQESLEAVQLMGKAAQEETQSVLDLLQEKNQALEGLIEGLAQQLKNLNEHCLALSWRLELQEHTLDTRLSQAQAGWDGMERQSLQDLSQWLKEVTAHLREVQEKVDSLSRQIESISDKSVLHKSDADQKISSESKARESEVGAVRQELATLLLSVQLLKEDNPGRKIAEIQGQLATFQKQMIKLENNIQAYKTIQNLKFNTETKLRTEEIGTLRESVLSLWSEAGPWELTLGSKRVFMSLVRQRFFIKDVAPGQLVPVNSWGLYQALRWLQWKTILMHRRAQQRPPAAWRSPTRSLHPSSCP